MPIAAVSLTYIKTLVVLMAVTLTALLTMSVSTASATPVSCASQAFCGDYETGDFSKWHTQFLGGDWCGDACTIDNVGNATGTIVTSPVKQGMKAAKFQVFSSGGGASTNNRAEVLASVDQTGGYQGQEWFYGWWTYFPGPSQTWWSNGGDWNTTFQFYDKNALPQGEFIGGGVDATSGHPTLYDDGPFGHTTLADPLQYNHWYHFVVRAKWSSNSSVGLWKLWLDGAVKQPLVHMATYTSNSMIVYSQGFYSARNTDNTVIQDGFCRAATRPAANAC